MPAYGYTASGAPPGAGTSNLDPLGYAFSQAQANGWWTSGFGAASADDFAAAGKILFDNVVWGQPIPSMGPGLSTAFADLDGWYDQAAGATGPPVMSLGIAGGGTIIDGSAFLEVHVQFPGSGSPVVGLGLLMTITGGTFNSPGGSSQIGVSTDANGDVVVPLFAPAGSAKVTVASAAGVGNVGIGFYQPDNAFAQDLATVPSPTVITGQLELRNIPPSTFTGTLSIKKTVNDGPYYGPGGAVFDVSSNGAVVATLATNATGSSPETPALPVGSYQITEVTPPPGYLPGPQLTVTVVAFVNIVVSFSGRFKNLIRPASVTIAKRDGETGRPLDGAVFDVRYDRTDDGVYGEDLGECTTNGPTGSCSPPGDDGTTLLPGDYQVTEVQAPPGYATSATDDTQTITLTPGEHGEVTFDDYQGGLKIVKSGNDAAYDSIVGAEFTVAGPLPATTSVGTLTVGTATGSTPELYPLAQGTYVVTETVPPTGYSPVTPVTVHVDAGKPTATVVDVLDPIQPATVSLTKVDAETGAPLAGAGFTVAYAPVPGGPYSQGLGTCTTTATGSCDPAGNDGPAALLPGDYRVTELDAPAGYLLPTDPVQDLSLVPGQVGTVTFADQPLVPVSFQKVATGNVNPTQVTYSGAVIDVHQGTASGPEITTCTTDAAGACTTSAVLDGGSTYCWVEVTAPSGLEAGASGCFTASEAQAAVPIVVSDPGLFVAITAKKVDAADPTLGLPGAVFDLYRMDAGTGPSRPTPPAGAGSVTGGTWVARSTSGSTAQPPSHCSTPAIPTAWWRRQPPRTTCRARERTARPTSPDLPQYLPPPPWSP